MCAHLCMHICSYVWVCMNVCLCNKSFGEQKSKANKTGSVGAGVGHRNL